MVKDPNPQWYGYSLAKWDGDTLVVDSSGFNGKACPKGASCLEYLPEQHEQQRIKLREYLVRMDFERAMCLPTCSTESVFSHYTSGVPDESSKSPEHPFCLVFQCSEAVCDCFQADSVLQSGNLGPHV